MSFKVLWDLSQRRYIRLMKIFTIDNEFMKILNYMHLFYFY